MKEFKSGEEVYFFDGITVPSKAKIVCQHTEKINNNLSYKIQFLDQDPEQWSANRITFDWYLYQDLKGVKKAIIKHINILQAWVARPF